MKIVLILLLSAFTLQGFQQNKPAYRIFDQEGNSKGFNEFTQAALEADMVFFGERHNNPIAHWLRQETLAELYEADEKELIIGAEMFERDDQLILDEYMRGWTAERNFEEEAKLWGNYETDYKPMVEWAVQHDVPLIATNIPRRYAAMVARHGPEYLDQLDEQAQSYIAPLPLEVDMELKSYKEMMQMAGDHGSENMVKAQAIKDATMAHSILEHFEQGKHRLFHVNGAFHTLYGEGIIWYLEQEKSDFEKVTISTVEQQQTDSLETRHQQHGDFILVVSENMTRTH